MSVKVKKHKLLGFRSGKPWKMAVASVYYLICTAIAVVELLEKPAMASVYPISTHDMFIRSLEILILYLACMSPAIFISDFTLRDHIILLRLHDARWTTIAISFIILFLIIVYACLGYLHTNRYTICRNAYQQNKIVEFDEENGTYTIVDPTASPAQ
jgi:hypothetical protein